MEKTDKKLRKEKIIVISIALIILFSLLIFIGFKLKIFSLLANSNPGEKENFIYSKYKQICSKDDSYFEELASLVGGTSRKLREIKFKSTYCDTTEMQNITKDDLANLKCECLDWEIRACQQGWQLVDKYCYQGNLMTNSLKICSYYKCEGNYFVVVEEND